MVLQHVIHKYTDYKLALSLYIHLSSVLSKGKQSTSTSFYKNNFSFHINSSNDHLNIMVLVIVFIIVC